MDYLVLDSHVGISSCGLPVRVGEAASWCEVPMSGPYLATCPGTPKPLHGQKGRSQGKKGQVPGAEGGGLRGRRGGPRGKEKIPCGSLLGRP